MTTTNQPPPTTTTHAGHAADLIDAVTSYGGGYYNDGKLRMESGWNEQRVSAAQVFATLAVHDQLAAVAQELAGIRAALEQRPTRRQWQRGAR